jgi:hypothetical protein
MKNQQWIKGPAGAVFIIGVRSGKLKPEKETVM